MLSLEEMSKLLTTSYALTDAQLVTLRHDLYAMARATIGSLAEQWPVRATST